MWLNTNYKKNSISKNHWVDRLDPGDRKIGSRRHVCDDRFDCEWQKFFSAYTSIINFVNNELSKILFPQKFQNYSCTLMHLTNPAHPDWMSVDV